MFNRIISLFLLLFTGQVIALDLELTQGINSALPIAINSFGSNAAAQEIGNVIENDLTISGQFKIISECTRREFSIFREYITSTWR